MGDRNDRLADSSPAQTSYREEKFNGNRGMTNRDDGIMRKGDPGYDAYMKEAQESHEAFMKQWRAKNGIAEPDENVSVPSLDSPKF